MLSAYSFGRRYTYLKYATIHIGAKRHTIYYTSSCYKIHCKDHMVLPSILFQYMHWFYDLLW